MCGRLNCYCKYSSYSERVAKKLKDDPPEWIDPSKFRPSPNIAPTLHVPVLLKESGRLVIRSMKWGIFLPHVQSLVHNVRIETLSSSKFFQNLTAQEQTCAVLCDGFYEWKGKRPFFFFDSQNGFDESTISEWSEEEWTEKGPPVMALAGVYHKDADNYSCSVITREATQTNHIHHRITILLSTKEEILTWLSSPASKSKLLQLNAIKNDTLSYYEVHDRVNSSKYQGNDCHVPKSKASSSGPLDQWFSRKGVTQASNLSETSENISRKRKNSADFPTHQKKSAPSQKSNNPKTSDSSSFPAKTKSGPLDRWFSKNPKPPQ